MASPISAQHPAQQRTAEEPRADFDMRMMDMVALLESTDSIFFRKLVSKSMATEDVQRPLAFSLEFPIAFIKQHRKKFGKDAFFMMKDSQRTWPIKLTERSFKQSKRRVFAYGADGWKTFLEDNHIKVGDVLIFSLISFSQFLVDIGRAPVEVHPDADGDDNEDENEDNMDFEEEDDDEDENENNMDFEEEDDNDNKSKWFINPSPWWNAEQVPACCTGCKHAPPTPRFAVAIRRSTLPSLAVPGSFWDLHRNVLKCDDLQLRGPNKVIFTVKAKRTYNVDEQKLSVSLESGWEAFVVANNLRVGDILEFILVGNSCFTVTVWPGLHVLDAPSASNAVSVEQ